MDTESGSQIIGTAMVVYGVVKVESADGVTKTIQPNEPIKIDDRIDTGQEGSVTIIFNNDTEYLELGRMTDMVIDQDVSPISDVPDLADVTVVSDLIQDILDGVDMFVQPPLSAELAVDSDTADTADSGALMAAPEKVELNEDSREVVSTESGDGSSVNDDLDLANLIPPPDDIT